MEEKELQKLFCSKIELEVSSFKRKILKQNPENIFEKAYQIECVLGIYELLLEMSWKIEGDTLKKLLVFPNLLAFLYGRWLKKEDSFQEELQECLEKTVSEIQVLYEKAENENKEDRAA